jgi:hypothetical protein
VNSGDCNCNAASQCVPAGSCSVVNEAADCGQGFYCTNDTFECAPLPACTEADQTPCTNQSLQCNLGTNTCERAQTCSGNGDCTQAPTTYCNINVGVCEVPNCLNGGVVCSGNTPTCGNDGRCVGQGGGPCTSNSECAPDPWPNTEYCSFATGTGLCTSGCRSDADCPVNTPECDGTHSCVQAGQGGGGQWGDSCMGDTDCQAGLLCGILSGTCAEPCGYADTACAGIADCCPLSGAARCNLLGFCSN